MLLSAASMPHVAPQAAAIRTAVAVPAAALLNFDLNLNGIPLLGDYTYPDRRMYSKGGQSYSSLRFQGTCKLAASSRARGMWELSS